MNCIFMKTKSIHEDFSSEDIKVDVCKHPHKLSENGIQKIRGIFISPLSEEDCEECPLRIEKVPNCPECGSNDSFFSRLVTTNGFSCRNCGNLWNKLQREECIKLQK